MASSPAARTKTRSATPTPLDAVNPRRRLRNLALTLAAGVVGIIVLYLLDGIGSSKLTQALALFAIWGIATVSLNLINGTMGILSLGHHGFMLIGGYTTGLLTLSEASRQNIVNSGRSTMTEGTLALSVTNLFNSIGLSGLTTPETEWVRFVVAVLIGGLVAAVVGLIVGFPSLRLRGDYLAIVTFGFGEVIRLSASTRIFSPITNGALGFAGVNGSFGKSVWWTFGFLALAVFVISKIKYSSYGRAMQAIREDEVAAEAMGVNLAYHKVLGFVISALFAGIAGGLWVSWLAGVRLEYFLFQLTFFFLVAISAGGTGSITGVLLGTALVVFVRQYGDPLEETYSLQTWLYIASAVMALAAVGSFLLRYLRRVRPRFHPTVWVPAGLAVVGVVMASLDPAFLEGTFRGFGMRAIFLSVLLIVIMIFRPEGIVGRAEFSWGKLFGDDRSQPTEEEVRQDAWLSNPALNAAAGAGSASAGTGPAGTAPTGSELDGPGSSR
ncbi:MAG TPA: branched-chain amino acid ABC transporter permease, partial [Trueperaceae bacterium]|nr:branched-chain amino acid ABC transporter permease [Trueperaceae bacterium]